MDRFSSGIVYLLCAICYLLPSGVSAEIPHLIRYQGTAEDSSGVALEGPYDMTFTLYDAQTNGTVVWTEKQLQTPFSHGEFSVLLGQVTALDNVNWSQPLWLAMKVGSDPELSPRQRITSVPLALIAEQLDGPIHTVNGNVGIGTTSPAANLEIRSDVHNDSDRLLVRGDIRANMKFQTTNTGDNYAYIMLDQQAYDWEIGSRNQNGDLYFNNKILSGENGSPMVITNAGNVGIGAIDPGSYRLYVNGPAYATGGFTGSSRTMKTDIQPLAAGEYAGLLDQLGKLEVVRFKWKEQMRMDDGLHLGIIAEEAPSEITNQGKTAIGTSEYLAFLAASVKALKAENDSLKTEQAALQTQHALLQARIVQLEQQMATSQDR